MVYSDRVYLDTQGSLILENAQESDSAKYVCQVENMWGKEVESAFVDVRNATKVVLAAKNRSYVAGINVTLQCEVEVDPRLEEELNITWTKDNERSWCLFFHHYKFSRYLQPQQTFVISD
jgi:hypothetical protein